MRAEGLQNCQGMRPGRATSASGARLTSRLIASSAAQPSLGVEGRMACLAPAPGRGLGLPRRLARELAAVPPVSGRLGFEPGKDPPNRPTKPGPRG